MYGKRYEDKVDARFAGFVRDALPYQSFETAAVFYNQADKFTTHQRRFLGAVDRYYLLTKLLNRADAICEWVYDRCREVNLEPDGFADLWARFHYKDQSRDVDVLTTLGWKKHGDLAPGDYVFGADGFPTKVLATRSFTDSACRRVTFDNGVSFVCGAGHLWTIERTTRERVSGTKNGRKGRKSVTLETDAIALLNSLYRPVVRAALPLQTPRADLLVDPYVLGAWLGDGTSATGSVCGMDDEVFDGIESAGFRLSHNRAGANRHPLFRFHTIYGLSPMLRALGVLGNKHIPDSYMMAAVDQRLALLQGLIDTDGSASPDNGCITFAQTDLALAEQVKTLACSLGFKARLTPVRAGTGSWHVVFQATRTEHPCRVARKLAALPERSRRIGSRGWRVHSIEPVETVPTNCIQVDAPDGLYLVGREFIPTHNSTIITFAGSIQEIINDPDVTIGIFSADLDIAIPFVEQIRRELEDNDYLKALYPDILYANPRQDSPLWRADRIIVRRSSNPKEATVEAQSILRLRTGRHYKLRIYNDMVNEANVTETDTDQRGKVVRQWELSQSLKSHDSNRMWLEGTRYHYADAHGVIVERMTLIPRIYPATHNGRLDGDPVFLDKVSWEETKRNQKSVVAAQMLLNPVEGNANTFTLDWARFYQVTPRYMNIYILCDPSLGRRKSSDRTAIAVIGIDSQSNRYLLDGYCHRMKLSERWKYLSQLFKKYKLAQSRGRVAGIWVGYERYGMQSDIEYFDEQIFTQKIEGLQIEEVGWVREGPQSKNARIGRLEPFFRDSGFWLPPYVWHPDYGKCTWRVAHQELGGSGDNTAHAGATIRYKPFQSFSKEEARAIATGERWRLTEPVKRVDENGDIYDLVRIFFEEFRLHPFAPTDDFLDTMSRVEDMTPRAAVKYDEADLQPERHYDS